MVNGMLAWWDQHWVADVPKTIAASTRGDTCKCLIVYVIERYVTLSVSVSSVIEFMKPGVVPYTSIWG